MPTLFIDSLLFWLKVVFLVWFDFFCPWFTGGQSIKVLAV